MNALLCRERSWTYYTSLYSLNTCKTGRKNKICHPKKIEEQGQRADLWQVEGSGPLVQY